MKKRILTSLIVVAALACGSWLLHRQPGRRAPVAPGAAAVERTSQPPGGHAAALTVPASGSAKAADSTASGPVPARQVKVGTARLGAGLVPACLTRYATQYEGGGLLTADEAKALIARREQAAKELVAELAAFGPGGARAVAEAYDAAGELRVKLLLVAALGRINDSEAGGILAELLAHEVSPDLQKAMVHALRQRGEPSAVGSLAGLLAGGSSDALQFEAVQALAGRPDALPALTASIEGAGGQAVRLEAIHSVGLMNNEAAKAALVTIAQNTAMTPAVREMATQELGRSFGAGAMSSSSSQ